VWRQRVDIKEVTPFCYRNPLVDNVRTNSDGYRKGIQTDTKVSRQSSLKNQGYNWLIHIVYVGQSTTVQTAFRQKAPCAFYSLFTLLSSFMQLAKKFSTDFCSFPE